MTTMKELERWINKLIRWNIFVVIPSLSVALALGLVAFSAAMNSISSLPSGYEEVCVEWDGEESVVIYGSLKSMNLNRRFDLFDGQVISECDNGMEAKPKPIMLNGVYHNRWVVEGYGNKTACNVRSCTAYQLVRRVAE